MVLGLIARSSLVEFSMLCTIYYYYGNGPVIVENLKILTIRGGILLIVILQPKFIEVGY